MSLNDFWIKLLGKLGMEPTPWRLEFFNFWASQEGMPYGPEDMKRMYPGNPQVGTFNPLATTRFGAGIRTNQGFDIGHGGGNWNSVPVRVYADEDAGVEATYQTIALNYYNNIRRALLSQMVNTEVISDFKTWVGSEAYGKRVYEHMLAYEANSSTVIVKASPIEEMNEALMKRFAIMRYASNLNAMACGDYDDVIALYNQLKKFF